MIDQRAKPRLIVIIEDGMLQQVYFDHIDLKRVDLIVLDRDTETADQDDLIHIAGKLTNFAVCDMSQAPDDVSRDIGRAYLNWSLS